MKNKRESAKGRVGRAYAFFNCDASKEEIESAVPDIREYVGTPEDLEFRLYEGISELELDNNLAELLKESKDYRIMREKQKSCWDGQREEMPLSELQYILVANYPKATNRKAAEELGSVMDCIHYLNRDETVFRGAVVYEENGKYLFRE